MPITTSVITGTVAHKHSATGGSGDGGKLATGGLGGDTSFDLANGSLMFSNGTSLDELVIGGAGTVLTEAGGVPTWGAAGGSAYEFLGSSSIVSGSPLTVSFSAVTNPDFVISTFAGEAASSQEVAYQVNGITSSTYNNQGTYFLAGGNSNQNVTNNDKFYGISSGITGTPQGVTYFKVFTNPISENIFTQSESYTAANGYSIFGGYNSTAAHTSITSITCLGNAFSGTLSCWAVRN